MLAGYPERELDFFNHPFDERALAGPPRSLVSVLKGRKKRRNEERKEGRKEGRTEGGGRSDALAILERNRLG